MSPLGSQHCRMKVEPKADPKIVIRSRVLCNNYLEGFFTEKQVLFTSIVELQFVTLELGSIEGITLTCCARPPFFLSFSMLATILEISTEKPLKNNIEREKDMQVPEQCDGSWVPGGNFCWVCAAGLSEPLPHYSLLGGHIIDPMLVTFGKKVISQSQISHFLFMHLP